MSINSFHIIAPVDPLSFNTTTLGDIVDPEVRVPESLKVAVEMI